MKKFNLILTDSRSGNGNQAIALAKNLDIPFKILHLDYNNLAYLPNILLPKSFLILKDKNLITSLGKISPCLIISCGRKTAIIALALKKLYQDSKIIQILRPNLQNKYFDLIILPYHDKFFFKNQPNNIVRVHGALAELDYKILETFDEFKVLYPNMSSDNYITVLIGGNNKSFKFTDANSFELLKFLENMQSNFKVNLFISYSRRTPNVLKNILSNLKNDKNIFYDPNENLKFNPYPSVIKNSKFVIVTCDSVSMISEIVTTGKPLFVYVPENFKVKKHLSFISKLESDGLIKIINSNSKTVQEYNYTPLNEAKKVAIHIQNSIISIK